jgi:hypothetical protein
LGSKITHGNEKNKKKNADGNFISDEGFLMEGGV